MGDRLSDTASAYVAGWDSAAIAGARDSPARVVPVLGQMFRPASVVDVGCGLGSWLAAFREHGVADIVGIEGSWIDEARAGTRRSMLRVPRECLVAHDLAQPIDLGRRFDLAVSLEVAEHLPASTARGFVQLLTSLAPVVVFSAAVPFQGGTSHLNEQWPSYWAGLFAERGYAVADCLRPLIWNDERVAWYYRQNMLVFASEAGAEQHGVLDGHGSRGADARLDVVHPERYLQLAPPSPVRLYELVRGRLKAGSPTLGRSLTATKRRLRRS